MIITNSIPSEFKCAIVTPLYKGKGSKREINNYRGISVLPPLAKLFEKVLASQIFDYFESNKLFYAGQHGFRKGFSCETALHELLSEINNNLDKRLINMLLFIDYRKAFDLVDVNLLLLKLFHYGFNNNAISLISNYFSDRTQQTKIGQTVSEKCSIKHGEPQGSV